MDSGLGTTPRYAIKLDTTLPSDLPQPARYPFSTDTTEQWYAVVSVGEDVAEIEDVRRSDWPLPEGVIDWRGVE